MALILCLILLTIFNNHSVFSDFSTSFCKSHLDNYDTCIQQSSNPLSCVSMLLSFNTCLTNYKAKICEDLLIDYSSCIRNTSTASQWLPCLVHIQDYNDCIIITKQTTTTTAGTNTAVSNPTVTTTQQSSTTLQFCGLNQYLYPRISSPQRPGNSELYLAQAEHPWRVSLAPISFYQ